MQRVGGRTAYGGSGKVRHGLSTGIREPYRNAAGTQLDVLRPVYDIWNVALSL